MNTVVPILALVFTVVALVGCSTLEYPGQVTKNSEVSRDPLGEQPGGPEPANAEGESLKNSRPSDYESEQAGFFTEALDVGVLAGNDVALCVEAYEAVRELEIPTPWDVAEEVDSFYRVDLWNRTGQDDGDFHADFPAETQAAFDSCLKAVYDTADWNSVAVAHFESAAELDGAPSGLSPNGVSEPASESIVSTYQAFRHADFVDFSPEHRLFALREAQIDWGAQALVRHRLYGLGSTGTRQDRIDDFVREGFSVEDAEYALGND